jgi:hypothetical protein
VFIFVSCESKEKQDSRDSSVTASHGVIATPNLTSLPVSPPILPPEPRHVQSLTEIKQNYLNALEQAKQINLAAIEQSNENYSRAIEHYEQEYWSTVDKYRNMTPAEKALIHSRSLVQIGHDHDTELRQSREEYYTAVESAKHEYDEQMHSIQMNVLNESIKASIPDKGESELFPGGHFFYKRYPHGYLVNELCSETISQLCYPLGWRPWLKELEQRTAGDQINALNEDTRGQVPGTIVVSWDSQDRVLFWGVRPHSGGDGCAYFIVAPKTRELDIIWKNEQGVKYLGPDASLLKSSHVYEWLKTLSW